MFLRLICIFIITVQEKHQENDVLYAYVISNCSLDEVNSLGTGTRSIKRALLHQNMI